MNADEYKQYLSKKLEVAERINKNSISQCEAMKFKDAKLLGKLLKRQQGNINKLKRIEKSCLQNFNFKKDEEIEKLESSINSLLETAIRTSTLNIPEAEKLKNEIGFSLYNLKVNKNAIQNGYLKSGYQQHGYFIDKKVGR